MAERVPIQVALNGQNFDGGEFAGVDYDLISPSYGEYVVYNTHLYK